jgi:hypothetical protein
MLRILLVGIALALLTAAPSGAAVLVYERVATHEIVVAYADGSHAHVIAHGRHPTVSPNARLVAFFKIGAHGIGRLCVVARKGGPTRCLVSYAYGQGGYLASSSVPWSRDSRFVVVGDEAARGCYLVDVKRGTSRLMTAPRSFGEAAFSPRDDRFVVLDANDENQMYLGRAPAGRLKRFAHGGYPEWGPRGVAFDSGSGLVLKPVGEPRRVLIRGGDGEPFVVPIDWSLSGKTLLGAENIPDEQRWRFTPVLVRLPSGHVSRLPAEFAFIDALSRDGTLVLAETAEGNVVSMPTDGTATPKVLASGGTEATWTR